jgi:hypothetical protein
MAYVISQNKAMYDSPEFQAKFGSMIKDLDTKRRPGVGTYWVVINQVRWIVTISIMIIIRDHNGMQLVALLVISWVFQGLIICGRPWQSTLENKMTLFNEIMVSVYLYILMILTDFFAETNPFREDCGWALVMTLLTTFSVNFIKFLVLLPQNMRTKMPCKKKKTKR